MMRYVVASFTLIVGGFSLAALAADKPTAEGFRAVAGDVVDQQEFADLKAEIAKVHAELNGLKERVAMLEDARKFRIQPVPAPRPLANPIPPDWRRREFNGQQYFIIPLAKDPSAGKD